MPSEKSTKLSIVIPLFNEAENLQGLISALQELAGKLEPVELEFILVDDGSRDGTFDVASRIARENKNVTLLKFARNYGSHAALAAGFTYATGDCAMFMAGDMQDPPGLITEMLDAWRTGAKIVWAARTKVQGQPLKDEMFSKAYWFLFNLAVDYPVAAGGVDFALIDKSVVDIITKQSQIQHPIFAQIVQTGFPSKTIYYLKQKRQGGKSGWTMKKKIGLVMQTLFFSPRPFRIGCYITIAICVLSAILFTATLAVAIGDPLLKGLAVATAIVVHLIVIAQFKLMLMLSENVNIYLSHLNQMPRYHIEEVITRATTAAVRT